MNVVYVTLLTAILSAVISGWGGIQWQKGRNALALEAAQKQLKTQIAEADESALQFAKQTTAISKQLGDARARLYTLTSGRDCLSPTAVRLLNDFAVPRPNTPASQPAGATDAAATDRDVGDALAVCRAGYSKLSNQLNAILDIEDGKHMRQ